MYDEQALRKLNRVVKDLLLSDVVGTDGLANQLFQVELSEKGVYRFRDLKEFIEVLRRLHVPYWEQARLYWEKALKDGYHDGCDFSEKTLQSVIERYEDN